MIFNAMPYLAIFEVRSGVLTVEEVLGVYQFNSNPFLYLRGEPGLYSLKFPSHGRIFNWNKARANRRGTLALEFEKVSEFARESVGSSRLSDAVEIKGLAWEMEAKITMSKGTADEKKCLEFYLWYDGKEGALGNSLYSATFRILSEGNIDADNSIGTLSDYVINRSNSGRGFDNFITFAELMEPSNGFYNREEDKVILAIDVITVDEPKVDKCISVQSKSSGTISMDIEKVSEFAREIIWSERESETVHIKGLPWKIFAQISPKNGSTDSNEKWLYFPLCVMPRKKMEIGVAFFLQLFELCRERAVPIQRNNPQLNFNIIKELMDPFKGLYDKREDKVTLAIDVTVKEAKMEDKS
ncbi:hypothetical protein niasHT_006004 [Heterodera trifolii]|uniref:MATH domain-containing protein n=1 Tax=Heterodera trifolii TaxID=157864 RepID=A0ABD2LWY5_9BILA